MLSTKKRLAQYILLLGYTSLPPPWELPDDSTEPFFRGVEIPVIFRMALRNHSSGVLQYHPQTATSAFSLPLLKLRSQLNTEVPAGALSPETADNRRLRFNYWIW
jgi:hypothetical protein